MSQVFRKIPCNKNLRLHLPMPTHVGRQIEVFAPASADTHPDRQTNRGFCPCVCWLFTLLADKIRISLLRLPTPAQAGRQPLKKEPDRYSPVRLFLSQIINLSYDLTIIILPRPRLLLPVPARYVLHRHSEALRQLSCLRSDKR